VDANERRQIGDLSHEWMRIHTRVDANGFTIYRRGCKQFSGGLITAEPTPSGARKDLAGQIVKLAGLEEA
jgi:hypothetical protein